jgi:hypothetical protein
MGSLRALASQLLCTQNTRPRARNCPSKPEPVHAATCAESVMHTAAVWAAAQLVLRAFVMQLINAV